MLEARRHAVDGGRTGLLVAGILAVPALAALTALGGAALGTAFLRGVVTPPSRRSQDVRVLAVRPEVHEIELAASVDTAVRGGFSLWFDHGRGHARIGRLLATGRGRVVRELGRVDRGTLRAGTRGRLNGWLLLSPRETGLPFSAQEVPTQFGAAPAWLFPAAGDEASDVGSSQVWAIHVHGRATTREETLRGVAAFHRAGLTSLVVSYRNDGDAPASPDRRYALGETEWRDIDAAIRFAEQRGARRVVLVGWSMGGAIVLQTALRSSRRDMIAGLVLDSPVIDWRVTLRKQARLNRIPAPIAALALTVMQRPWSAALTGQSSHVPLASMDLVERAAELTAPVLLLHSVDDDFVPSGPSEALAAARGDLVELVLFHGAGHTRLWNDDPVLWEASVERWLAERALSRSGSSARR
ncbi:alpha/beta fold hydrolase [Rathayibacter sp. VKM Ac-2856]|uniref:alpha/beta hydrolase family protein n=1 Tax=unclassified Rathayibacter TaxID=2609250 RepID=UPI0015651579|nr:MULTISPECIES: alpha/beta fold hydrolase [unclassified Rathayibacter]NQX03534.1 alpha/beta fold hydrolase [Rathayibacter sp. VKM Ac-2858]NQX18702.1 alpha/beta fold hydrolase [Rathayibacter sp. VKM Ac-2856]